MDGKSSVLRAISSRMHDSYEFCHAKNATYHHRVDDPGAASQDVRCAGSKCTSVANAETVTLPSFAVAPEPHTAAACSDAIC